MAQQPTTAAIATIGGDLRGQTRFLHQLCTLTSNVFPGADIGHKTAEHNVLVFDGENGIDGHPVVLRIGQGGFSLQEYLTADEARTLAQALLMAADFSERTSLDRAVDAAMAAAGVAA